MAIYLPMFSNFQARSLQLNQEDHLRGQRHAVPGGKSQYAQEEAGRGWFDDDERVHQADHADELQDGRCLVACQDPSPRHHHHGI